MDETMRTQATQAHPPASGTAPIGVTNYSDLDAAAETYEPRHVRLTLSRVDPWSTMKLSFLLSVAAGIAMVVAVILLWQVLNGMGVFSSLNDTIRTAAREDSTFDLYDYIGLPRVISLATFIAVINVVITMALATVGAVLYNVASAMVGGLHVTLTDD